MACFLLAGASCDNRPGSGGGSIFSPIQSGKERWTIRCARLQTPAHRESADRLAQELGKVQGLRPRSVRVVSDATGSTIYYGEYTKVPSGDGSLVFPDEYQDDIELIRRLAYGRQTPFFYAEPELLSEQAPGAVAAEGDVSNAKGTHGLQIAVFYNTPTFDERKQSAEQYVKLLREQGYAAYYYHEAVKSFVFVGDFNASDLMRDPRDRSRYVFGPRVQQLIARNPEEFKYFMENGHHVIYRDAGGGEVKLPTVLIPLPGRGGEGPLPEPTRPELHRDLNR